MSEESRRRRTSRPPSLGPVMFTPRGCATLALAVVFALAAVKLLEAGRYVIGGTLLAVIVVGTVLMNRTVGR